MVRRTNSKTFAEERKVAPKERVQKPSRRGFGSAIIGFLLAALALAAILIAGCVSVYSVLALLKVDPPFNVPAMSPELIVNLLVGAIFFWLEVIAIVIGLRLIDRFSARQLARRQLFTIQALLAKLINAIDDERYNYAVNLDTSKQGNGGYTTDFGYLNIKLNQLKNGFIESVFCDAELTDTASYAVDRIIRLLDIFSNDTYELAGKAGILNRDNPSLLDQVLDDSFERTKTGGLRTIEEMLGRIRDKV